MILIDLVEGLHYIERSHFKGDIWSDSLSKSSKKLVVLFQDLLKLTKSVDGSPRYNPKKPPSLKICYPVRRMEGGVSVGRADTAMESFVLIKSSG